MAGTIDTQEVQIATEGSWGAGATGTARLMGITDCVFNPVKPSKIIRMLHGSLGVGNMGARMMGRGSGSIKGIVTYEDINYYLENIFGIVTPSGGGPYVRAGVAPLALASINPKYVALTKGDADGIYQLTGALVNELTLSVKQSEGDAEMLFDGKLLGKDVVTASLGSLSDRALTAVTANDFALWIDVPGAAPGTTAVASTAYGAEVKLVRAAKLKPYLGVSTPGGVAQPSFDATKNTLTLSFELNATSKAFLDSIIGAAVWQKNVRLKATNGTNVFQMDMGVQAVDAPAIVTDNDGIKSVVVNCIALETTGLGNWFKYSTTTGVAVLP